MMRRTLLLHIFLFVSGLYPLGSFAENFEVSEVSILNIKSAITPATYDYLRFNLKRLPDKALILVKMNTPGGLISTTKDIITLLSNQSRPITIWITPEGASASSAGAIIASSAHLIFMNPGTNIGAATPVGLSEEIKQGDLRSKAINDLTALVRSLSESRGRPGKPFEDMIKTAESYTDKEALKMNIINGIVSSQSELIEAIKGKEITIQGKKLALSFKEHFEFKNYDQTLGQKILEVLTHPSIAYFLFLIGIALIYFELQAPGGYIAGGVGTCFLILAAMAFQVLPLNWGSLGLVIAGVVLLVMEIFVVSYGVLSILGIAAFIIGSLFLFHGKEGYISVEYPVLLSTLAGVGFSVGIILCYLYREQRKNPSQRDFFLPVDAEGVVLTHSLGKYQIKVRGEIWNATSTEKMAIGDKVQVVSIDRDQLQVQVKKINAV